MLNIEFECRPLETNAQLACSHDHSLRTKYVVSEGVAEYGSSVTSHER